MLLNDSYAQVKNGMHTTVVKVAVAVVTSAYARLKRRKARKHLTRI